MTIILFLAGVFTWGSYHALLNHFISPKHARDIIIYTTTWCPYCKALKNTLDGYRIAYVEYDTEKSLTGFMVYNLLGRRGVPMTVIGGRVHYGYDGQLLTEALADAGYEITDSWER